MTSSNLNMTKTGGQTTGILDQGGLFNWAVVFLENLLILFLELKV